jgi:hypothetical protein
MLVPQIIVVYRDADLDIRYHTLYSIYVEACQCRQERRYKQAGMLIENLLTNLKSEMDQTRPDSAQPNSGEKFEKIYFERCERVVTACVSFQKWLLVLAAKSSGQRLSSPMAFADLSSAKSAFFPSLSSGNSPAPTGPGSTLTKRPNGGAS